MKITLYRDPADLKHTIDAWESLYRCHGNRSPATSPRYCLLALEHARREEASPLVIAASRDGELVGIWPMWLVRERRLTVGRHVGIGSNEEYAEPLAADTEAMEAMLDAALALCDVLAINNVRSDSLLLRRKLGWLSHKTPILSPVTRCGAAPSWEAWLAERTRNFRQSLRGQRRKLEKQGVTHIGAVRRVEIDDFVEWMIETKCRWLSNRSKKIAGWLQQPESWRFVKAALADPRSKLVGHAISLDGQYIAGALCLSGSVHEYMITAYDPAFASFSPGHVLTGHCVEQAIADGSDFDFRITHDAYKLRWIDDYDRRYSLIIASTVRAMPMLVRLYFASLRKWQSTVRKALLKKIRAR